MSALHKKKVESLWSWFALDFVLDELIKLHLVVVQLSSQADVLRAKVFDLQLDALQFSSLFFFFPAHLFQHAVHLGKRLLLHHTVALLSILNNGDFLLSIEFFFEGFQGTQILLFGLAFCLPNVAFVFLIFEIAVLFIDYVVVIEQLGNGSLVFFFKLIAELLEFLFVFELPGLLKVLQLISESLKFFFLLPLAFLNEFLHLDLALGFLGLYFYNTPFVSQLHLLHFFCVLFLFTFVLSPESFRVFLHLFANDLILHVLYLVLQHVVQLLGIIHCLLLFLLEDLQFFSELIIYFFLCLFELSLYFLFNLFLFLSHLGIDIFLLSLSLFLCCLFSFCSCFCLVAHQLSVHLFFNFSFLL